MRKLALLLVAFALLGVVACNDDDGATTTTTVAPTTSTTTSITTTTTPTTTTTEPVLTGILVFAPEGCDTCDALVGRLEELARGEIPIEVRVEGDRPAVQVFDVEGTMTAEWVGTESTIHPSDRATAENAEAIIRAACDAIGTCSPDTTSTTTTIPADLILQPNDVVCGMDVERRYNFDGTRPAPLGVIWGNVFSSSDSRVLSGILVNYAPHPTISNSYYTDFLFVVDDECVVFRFALGAVDGDHYLVVNGGSSSISDLLPFGNSEEAQSVEYDSRVVDRSSVVRRLVVGRQYVFEVRLTDDWECPIPNPPGCVPITAREIVAFLEGRSGTVPVGEAFVNIWFAPTGSL